MTTGAGKRTAREIAASIVAGASSTNNLVDCISAAIEQARAEVIEECAAAIETGVYGPWNMQRSGPENTRRIVHACADTIRALAKPGAGG